MRIIEHNPDFGFRPWFTVLPPLFTAFSYLLDFNPEAFGADSCFGAYPQLSTNNHLSMNNATTLIRAATKSQMDCDLLRPNIITRWTKIKSNITASVVVAVAERSH